MKISNTMGVVIRGLVFCLALLAAACSNDENVCSLKGYLFSPTQNNRDLVRRAIKYANTMLIGTRYHLALGGEKPETFTVPPCPFFSVEECKAREQWFREQIN